MQHRVQEAVAPTETTQLLAKLDITAPHIFRTLQTTVTTPQEFASPFRRSPLPFAGT